MPRPTLNLPANIRAARVRSGLTQGQMALALGLRTAGGRSYVSRVEAGQHVPRLEKLLTIARITGTPIEKLLEGA